MPPSMRTCEDCGQEMYAMHLPRHRFKEHGIGEAPRAGRQRSSGGGSAESIATGAAEPPPSSAPAAESAEAAPGGGESQEVAPRKPGMLERFRSRRGRGRGGQHQGPSTAERPPRRPRGTGRRVALDTDISDIWAFGGRRLENSPHFATGRMLQYQAPAAGVILDRAIAGTLPDRLFFQPIARNRDKYEDVGFLLAGPLLTFTITATGQQMEVLAQKSRIEWDEDDVAKWQELSARMEMLKEMFVWVLSMMLPRLAEGKKKADEKKAKADAAIGEAFPDLGADDPVQVLATMLFEPPTYEEGHANGNGKHQPDRTAAPPDSEGAIPL